MGLEYKWMTLADGRADEAKMHVDVGTAAPAVCVDDDGVEVLECMNLTNETASIGFQGKQKMFTGAAPMKFHVLHHRKLH
ncbi:hypothetical protein OSTOST_14931 [Ostertagia ostertagi]